MKNAAFKLSIVSVTLFLMSISCTSKKSISAFKFLSLENIEVMRVDENGVFSIQGENIGKLLNNGYLTNNSNDTIAQRKPNGMVLDSDGNPMLKIENDGSLIFDETKNLHWTKDGKLIVDGKETLKIEPNDSSLYPSASLVFLIYSSFE